MLALQGYGSSDEECGKNEDINEYKDRSEVRNDNSSTNNSSIQLPPSGISSLSLGLQICAAPEVVPTVIYILSEKCIRNYLFTM